MSWLHTVSRRHVFKSKHASSQALDGGRRWLQWHEQFLSQQRNLKKVCL